jgi:hypothetical protein
MKVCGLARFAEQLMKAAPKQALHLTAAQDNPLGDENARYLISASSSSRSQFCGRSQCGCPSTDMMATDVTRQGTMKLSSGRRQHDFHLARNRPGGCRQL